MSHNLKSETFPEFYDVVDWAKNEIRTRTPWWRTVNHAGADTTVLLPAQVANKRIVITGCMMAGKWSNPGFMYLETTDGGSPVSSPATSVQLLAPVTGSATSQKLVKFTDIWIPVAETIGVQFRTDAVVQHGSCLIWGHYTGATVSTDVPGSISVYSNQ